METPGTGVRPMTDISAGRMPSAPLRFVWPRHTRKRIAAAFNVAIDTAKDWLVEGVPLARRQEMARVINAELDRIEAEARRFRQEHGR